MIKKIISLIKNKRWSKVILKNKVIVVTGGAGQIGREFVSAILQNDGVAIIADKDESQSNKIKRKNIS